MTDEQLERLVRRLRKQGRDDSLVEAKACVNRLAKDVWESVSAFANTEGGTLLLGVSEADGFAPVQGFEIEKVCDQFLSGMGDGGTKGKLSCQPHYSISRGMLDGLPVLVVEIDELGASHKPCFICGRGVQGGSYKRVDDADIPLSANEIYSLQNASVMSEADRLPVGQARVCDLDPDIYLKAFEKARQITPRALKGAGDDSAKLQRLNFTDVDGRVTKAGLLSAGMYPQQFFPKLHVDVAVHPGLAKATPGAPRFLDRTICEGTVGEMIEAAVAAVSRNLRRRSVVVGVGRTDELEIPEEVLREAVANALIHREYDSRFDGEAVSVDVYEDRVEVTNPGGLWGGKTRSNLADGRSCCRNATLMRLTSIVPLPSGAGSPAEGNGSGIPLMMSECAARGIKAPGFYPSIDHFKVVIYRPVGGTALGATAEPGAGSAQAVLMLIEAHGALSSREIAELSGLSINQVRSRVKELLESGTLEATAATTSRNRRYRLKA
ncbi:MAG: ATP-binding protein [Coriobacteriales bacterium]